MSWLGSKNNITTTGNVKITKIYEESFVFYCTVRFKNAIRNQIEWDLEVFFFFFFWRESDPEQRKQLNRNEVLWE